MKDESAMNWEVHKGLARLEKLGALQTAPSEKKRHTLYRLHESDHVRKPMSALTA
jgi:hypothetical protein